MARPKLTAEQKEQRIIETALRVLQERASYGIGLDTITGAPVAKQLARLKLGGLQNEAFAVMFLDNRNKLLSYETLFNGTINSASVYPRVIIKRALELNASGLILSHNHPSGDTKPSNDDIKITKKLIDISEIMDIRVLDHLIVGVDVLSFAETGNL